MMLSMTVSYYGEPLRDERPKKSIKDVQINPIVACVLCVLFVTVSGVISLIVNDPDQGQLVTAHEMEKRIASEVIRIQKDSHMPPQAKAFALGALSKGRAMQFTMPDQQIQRPH